MNANVLTGKLVRLTVPNIETDIELVAGWDLDSEYQRLYDSEPARLTSLNMQREWAEEWVKECQVFMIRTLADDKVIGTMELDGFNWASGDAWVGIGLGERDYWGQGYGTDAMRVLIRYAFEELNLKRISLTVFEYNQRAINSYRKLGFQEEGRGRDQIRRDGRYWDMVFMGLLRDEWQPNRTPNKKSLRNVELN